MLGFCVSGGAIEAKELTVIPVSENRAKAPSCAVANQLFSGALGATRLAQFERPSSWTPMYVRKPPVILGGFWGLVFPFFLIAPPLSQVSLFDGWRSKRKSSTEMPMQSMVRKSKVTFNYPLRVKGVPL